ncbi:Fic family protein [Frigoribacterium sp. MEB024]|uniref:Fic family protein n=1 Tax=Frigoribacterium sp. MEB024 TaxID=1589899 RepID=UPI0009E58E51|nr:Fic family protein [Frigoribacterium sp. MEB024]
MTPTRTYQTTHEWLTFKFDPQSLGSIAWAHLGEAFSKCQHLIGTPLQPALAMHLSEVFLRRGALASAAIEGNTLNEDQVEDILVNNRSLPESQRYQEQEVRNVVDALIDVRGEITASGTFRLSTEWMLSKHALLMRDLELEDHVVPGELRTVAVGVGTYKGAPTEDVPYLMEEMSTWINSIIEQAEKSRTLDQRFFLSFFAATLAHIYIAWIHPFGDGNGRTARLVEAAILAHSSTVPWVSTTVLSNYYNKTKPRYYQRLEAASRAMDLPGFIAYSAIGFRDELREQIEEVQTQQRRVAWINYVHEAFQSEPSTEIAKRRRAVVLALLPDVEYTKRDIKRLNADIAVMYATASDRLFSRDISKLLELKLIREVGRGRYQSNIELMDAFVPRPELGITMPLVVRQEDVNEGPDAAG